MLAPWVSKLPESGHNAPTTNDFHHGSPAVFSKTGSFASPSHDGFALVQVINSNDDFSTNFSRDECQLEIFYQLLSMAYEIQPKITSLAQVHVLAIGG